MPKNLPKALPAEYAWLGDLDAPRVIDTALMQFGVTEVPGPGNNPLILAWAKELGLEKVYVADSIAWCGLFAALVAKRAGYDPVKDPLWARNWLKFGVEAKEPSLGDILVFSRDGGGGHVGFYLAEDASAYHVLGGNQGDKVKVIRMPKARFLGARRPVFKIGQPSSVRPYRVAATGTLSRNEA